MEEDLKELEESIKEAYRCYDYDLDYNPLSKGIAEIIEHLIRAYKELKEIEQIHRQENGELRKQVKELEEENRIFALEGCRVRLKMHIDKNYIPVSLVQEKIEELKSKSGGNVFHIQQTINAEIRLLQELLEKRK